MEDLLLILYFDTCIFFFGSSTTMFNFVRYSDFLQKAATHVNKALTLDYGSVSDALANDPTMADALGGGSAAKGGSKGSKDDGEGKSDNGDAPDTMRPLDRFLMPLQKKLGMAHYFLNFFNCTFF